MSSAFRDGAAALALLAALTGGAEAKVLRVCADPNNLPFSNIRGEGFENRVVDIVAEELGAAVEYTWWAQRRGFFRETLSAGRCDLVPSVPAGFERTLNTRPWYRSSYAFVTRADGPSVVSFDDPALRDVRIGLQMAGDDGANPPPAHALAARGLTEHLSAYLLTADYAEPDPPARVVEAVVKGDVDVALVWGPLAGWAAARASPPLRVTPIADDGERRMAFSLAMGVRKGDRAFRDAVEAALETRRDDIARVLADYHVPTLPLPAGEDAR